MAGQARVTTLDVIVKGKTSRIQDDNYAIIAKNRVGGYLKTTAGRQLTTTKLRGIYALVMNVYTKINVPEDYAHCKGDIQYLMVRMAYEAGREDAVKRFLEETSLMEALEAVQSYEQFVLFCRYAESLVAYFKFFGGKE